MQDLIHVSTDLECEYHRDRQPTQPLHSQSDMISPSDMVDNASGQVLCSLESVGQSIIQSTIAAVKVTQHMTTYCSVIGISCQQVSDSADQA